MTGIVSLAMYDLPELTAVTDRWHTGLARAFHRAGISDFPAAPNRTIDAQSAWLDPALILSQTCGYPLVTTLCGRVRIVATPTYSAEGCEGPFYSSALVIRADETATELAAFRGRNFVFNEHTSHSGYNAIRKKLAVLAEGKHFFSSAVQSGSHTNSLESVAQRRADLTAVDCVTWALLQRHRPQLTQQLKVLEWTEKVPGLPLITRGVASDDMVERMRYALNEALNDPALKSARNSLLITGAEILSVPDYQTVRNLADEAARLNYSEIR